MQGRINDEHIDDVEVRVYEFIPVMLLQQELATLVIKRYRVRFYSWLSAIRKFITLFHANSWIIH